MLRLPGHGSRQQPDPDPYPQASVAAQPPPALSPGACCLGLPPSCPGPWWCGGVVLAATSCPASPGGARSAPSPCDTLAKVIFWLLFCFPSPVGSVWTVWPRGTYSCSSFRSVLALRKSKQFRINMNKNQQTVLCLSFEKCPIYSSHLLIHEEK